MKKQSKAIAIAAAGAGSLLTRFATVEAEAQRIHEEQSGRKLVRALLNGGGLHVLVSDGVSTIEVADGKVSLSVTATEGEEAGRFEPSGPAEGRAESAARGQRRGE